MTRVRRFRRNKFDTTRSSAIEKSAADDFLDVKFCTIFQAIDEDHLRFYTRERPKRMITRENSYNSERTNELQLNGAQYYIV